MVVESLHSVLTGMIAGAMVFLWLSHYEHVTRTKAAIATAAEQVDQQGARLDRVEHMLGIIVEHLVPSGEKVE
jgi:hypothetical protein